MSSATHSPTATIPTLRIAPPGGWLDLNLLELWHSRELLYFFVWKDIKVRYKQTAIGAAWAVLQPLLTMLVFTLFFWEARKDALGGAALSSLLLLRFASVVVFRQQPSERDQRGRRTTARHYKGLFSRLVLPLSAVAPPLLDFGIGFVFLVLMLIFYHVHPTPALLLLPLFLALTILTGLGIGLWLSALNAMYRDVRYVLPFLVQFWMFASPVAYPTSLVPERWRFLYGLNPMAGVIEGFRWALTGAGHPPRDASSCFQYGCLGAGS